MNETQIKAQAALLKTLSDAQVAGKVKLTKAEKMAAEAERVDREQARKWRAIAPDYAKRFAWVLFYATSHDRLFEVRKEDEYYTFRFLEGWGGTKVFLPVEFPAEQDWELSRNLADIEDTIAQILEEEREEERKQQVRRDALAKLSDEERQLLGL
jgi:cytochrome P450